MAVGHYQGRSATLSVLTRPAPTLLASCPVSPLAEDHWLPDVTERISLESD